MPSLRPRHVLAPALALAFLVSSGAVRAQQPAAPPPPAVGVIKVERTPVTETSQFLGRIQAINRVDLSARVTAFLDKRFFTEGSEVKKGDLLYQLERGPFEADAQAKEASVKQMEAQLQNANSAFDRAQQLLKSAAGTQATVDTTQANQEALAAQVQASQAQLRLSQINLAYTEIRAPIDGKIGRTTTTEGNVVSPSSGVLSTIVSQDPMYVVFSVPSRTALELKQKMAGAQGFDAVKVRIKLPDGRLYDQTGKLDFMNNSVTGSTDTLILRATIANPSTSAVSVAAAPNRELLDAEFVNVLLEGAQPVQALTIPRSAVLTDQSGDYAYIVDAQGKAQRQALKLGQTTPTTAVVASGLEEGQLVIVEGLQRVRPGQPVSAGPAAAAIQSGDVEPHGGSATGAATPVGRPTPGRT